MHRYLDMYSYDRTNDTWAVGCILSELLTSRYLYMCTDIYTCIGMTARTICCKYRYVPIFTDMHRYLYMYRYDSKDDMWAVGCILSELLTNTPIPSRCGGGVFSFNQVSFAPIVVLS